jgi:hypothetical protein
MSASSSAVSGVFSDGFSTILLLVAIEGATLCATWFSGWLKGVIAEIAVSGSRWVKMRRFLPCGLMSQEKACPSSRMQSWADRLKTSKARPTS